MSYMPTGEMVTRNRLQAFKTGLSPYARPAKGKIKNGQITPQDVKNMKAIAEDYTRQTGRQVPTTLEENAKGVSSKLVTYVKGHKGISAAVVAGVVALGTVAGIFAKKAHDAKIDKAQNNEAQTEAKAFQA